ncbi:MAG: DUF1501 domain-containing protein [Betaproteobacteria bacterium]|nr:DUF1501 domain-containing protein [Betaproteobacteria bacterium]
MTVSRRYLLTRAGLAALGGLTASVAPLSSVQAADYKAVVVVFLSGGHDGNNILVPTNGAYGDYQKSRPVLAHARDSLVPLSGTHISHTFGLAPSARAFAELFEAKRLAVVANVGALVQPTTIAQIRNNTAKLPPFLGSHTEQEQWVQGWMGAEDLSGWGGRMMDQFTAEFRNKQPLVALARDYTAVIGNSTPLSLADSNGGANWGPAPVDDPTHALTQRLIALSRLQSGNVYEAEVSRSMRSALLDAVEFARGKAKGPNPTGNFVDVQFSSVVRDLQFLARHIPYSKATGARRQIYLIQDGGYDTHTGQLDTGETNPGLDLRLQAVARSVSAFDKSLIDAGLDGQVLTVVMSEFGRTLDPAAGAGSDHAWGNHWFVVGGPVRGGVVYGNSFPLLVTGGADDAFNWNPQRGQWVPQFSSDQFMADIGRWMGLTAAQVGAAMPNLANFSKQTIGYL